MIGRSMKQFAALLALIGVTFFSPNADAQTFTNRTTTDGLGSTDVKGVYAAGGAIYAATNNGLGISTDGGTTFTNRTTANGLGNNNLFAVYVVGSNVYVGTSTGLSISTDGGAVKVAPPSVEILNPVLVPT